MADLDLRKLSAPIEALRDDVTEAYKSLDRQWEAVEKQLKSLPIPCDVLYGYSESRDGETSYYLAWQKIGGTRRICRIDYFAPAEEESIAPYEQWSGQQRCEMLKHVPGLFAKALDKTHSFIKDAQELGGQ